MALAALWMSPAAAQSQSLPCAYPLFLPVADGASWTYQDAVSATGTVTYTITNVSPNSFDDHTSYKPTAQASGGGVSRVNVDETNTFHCDSDGLSQTSHQEDATYTDGSTATAAFHDYAGRVLPRSVTSGTSWEYSFVQDLVTPDGTAESRYSDHVVASGPESVTVPAGTFNAFRLDHTATSTPLNYDDVEQQSQWTEWVAPGVGSVKLPTRELVAYTTGDQDCGAQGAESSSQAMQDLAALHAQEDGIDVPADELSGDGAQTELVFAQAPVSPDTVAAAFELIGLPGDHVQAMLKDGLLRFVIRLSPDGHPLLSLPALDNLIATTCVQPNSLQGARTLLVGAVQQVGDQIRVTGRTVDVATGDIQAAAQADGSVDTLASTLESALAGLPIHLSP